MREWNYNNDKNVIVASVGYFWSLVAPDGAEVTGPVSVSVSGLRDLRERRAALVSHGYTLKIERVVRYTEAKACYWCQARPRAWDMDCDGPYEMSTCCEPQCDAGYEWANKSGYDRYPFMLFRA